MKKPAIYAINIEATLIDGSSVKGVNAWIEDNKRVYKLSDGTELIGDKAVKSIEKCVFVVHPFQLKFLKSQYEVKQ